MAQLPVSTSMATTSPWWSASILDRMSRSNISLPRRAISAFGRVGAFTFITPVEASFLIRHSTPTSDCRTNEKYTDVSHSGGALLLNAETQSCRWSI